MLASVRVLGMGGRIATAVPALFRLLSGRLVGFVRPESGRIRTISASQPRKRAQVRLGRAGASRRTVGGGRFREARCVRRHSIDYLSSSA